jgi:hypothetical protein
MKITRSTVQFLLYGFIVAALIFLVVTLYFIISSTPYLAIGSAGIALSYVLAALLLHTYIKMVDDMQ